MLGFGGMARALWGINPAGLSKDWGDLRAGYTGLGRSWGDQKTGRECVYDQGWRLCTSTLSNYHEESMNLKRTSMLQCEWLVGVCLGPARLLSIQVPSIGNYLGSAISPRVGIPLPNSYALPPCWRPHGYLSKVQFSTIRPNSLSWLSFPTLSRKQLP